MGTVAASLDMTAKGGGAAGLDGAHRLELFERERVESISPALRWTASEMRRTAP